jgi:hypothetical protein
VCNDDLVLHLLSLFPIKHMNSFGGPGLFRLLCISATHDLLVLL